MENIFFDKKKLKYCGENVIIGKTVRIRKPEETIILDNTIIDDFTYISCAIEIGKNCHIASNVSISGGSGKFIMGDFSTISNHCSIHCASSDYVEVSLDLPSVPEEFRFGGEIGNVTLSKFITIGAHSCILPNVFLPDGFACAAFSLINNQNYSEFSLYKGIPVKFYKKRNIPNKLFEVIENL
jgi:acetyltransferase-like isoleucine patch superfamily enzyme